MYLRRANHTMVLQQKQHSDAFRNDATFLMDNAEKNESYTSLKLFSHRSWKLFSLPDSRGPLVFERDSTGARRGFDLLVIAQPCMGNDALEDEDDSEKSSLLVTKPKMSQPEVDVSSESKDVSSDKLSSLYDPVLNELSDRKYVTALTNKGKTKSIANEYSFEDYKIPDFIMHSLVEEDKNAGDGMEIPKPGTKPSASLVQDTQQKQKIEHDTKLPTAKQKISGISSLFNHDEVSDLEDTLRGFQYGSKGCKLLVAEDSIDENAATKDTVAHPAKKECKDEFPDSCLEMAKKGHCLAFKSLMSSVCRKSCNLCATLVDTGFTTCTKRCGGGRQLRMIKIHRREYLQTRRCNTKPCPIDGGFSEFSHFTECSATCGKGVQYRRRTCTKPRPQFNGRSCKRLGSSIESRSCDDEPCPNMDKHYHHDHPHKKKKKYKKASSKHLNTGLHIDGKHSDKVHEHLVLLKGKKVAKLRCTPKKGQLRSIIEDAENYKRFIIHGKTTKKSDIEEGKIVYNKEGLPVDTSRTVVKAFKSPYKIILARKGANKMKLVEECLEADDEDKVDATEDRTSDLGADVSEHETDDSEHSFLTRGSSHEKKKVYTRPGEKSFSDFDEYKYETGNVVTPQVTSHNNNYDFPNPSGKGFDQPKGLDFFLDKMNDVKPKLDEQLSEEEDLESSYKTENAPPVEGLTFNNEQQPAGHGGAMDSAAQAGFTVTTTPDSRSPQTTGGNGDSNGYEVESVADG